MPEYRHIIPLFLMLNAFICCSHINALIRSFHVDAEGNSLHGHFVSVLSTLWQRFNHRGYCFR